MGQRLLRLTFTAENVSEPIVYRMGREFALATNIRRANVTGDHGWVELELVGEDDDMQQAMQWATDKGVSVELVRSFDDV